MDLYHQFHITKWKVIVNNKEGPLPSMKMWGVPSPNLYTDDTRLFYTRVHSTQ